MYTSLAARKPQSAGEAGISQGQSVCSSGRMHSKESKTHFAVRAITEVDVARTEKRELDVI
jgi:hypothetical protein